MHPDVLEFIWWANLVLAVALTLLACRKLCHYRTHAKNQAARSRNNRGSSRNSSILVLLVLAALTGVMFIILGSFKLGLREFIGRHPVSTVAYCAGLATFALMAYQFVWTWVNLACKSSLQHAKVQAILVNMKRGFIVSAVLTCIAIVMPIGLLVTEDETLQFVMFAGHTLGLALANMFCTGYVLNIYGKQLVDMLRQSAQGTKTSSSVTPAAAASSQSRPPSKTSKAYRKFVLIRKFALVCALNNAVFFIVLTTWPWLRVRSSYVMSIVDLTILCSATFVVRMFSFASKSKATGRGRVSVGPRQH